MKIRKFNENSDIDNDIISEYIQDCFVEYIDNGSKFYDRLSGSGYCAVVIPAQIDIKTDKRYECKEFKNNLIKLSDIIDDIEVYIDRINMKFGDEIYTYISMSSTDKNLQIIFSKNKI